MPITVNNYHSPVASKPVIVNKMLIDVLNDIKNKKSKVKLYNK